MFPHWFGAGLWWCGTGWVCDVEVESWIFRSLFDCSTSLSLASRLDIVDRWAAICVQHVRPIIHTFLVLSPIAGAFVVWLYLVYLADRCRIVSGLVSVRLLCQACPLEFGYRYSMTQISLSSY